MQVSDRHYDCIVIGFGGVGSAAMRYAAMSGRRVLGIDQFGPAHAFGSSHGQTRVIRKSYFEHPNYVPLLLESYELWDELNKRHRTNPETKELLTTAGVLQVGHPDGEVVKGVLGSAAQHDLRVEKFSKEEIERRLPILNVPEGHVGVFEQDGGFLRVELCVAAFIKQALAHQTTLMSDTTVMSWRATNRSVEVTTDQGDFSADQLIVTAGPWTTAMLPELPLHVVAKQQHWYQLDRVEQKLANQFPCFLFQQENGDCFYGTPELDTLGLKVAEHTGGQVIQQPADLSRELDPDQQQRVEQFLANHFRFSRRRLVHHSMCMYTMSPDGHFFVDHHPEHQHVVFAAGLSGHGFKFVPAIGKRLVGMLDGESDPRFDFLSLR